MPTPVPHDVAADVVDQQLSHLHDAHEAPWLPRAVGLSCTDTSDSWTVLVAPADHGDGTLRVITEALAQQAPLGAEVAAPAAVLAPWLFNRTHDASAVRLSGDPALVHVLRLALGHGIEPMESPAPRRWFRR